MNHLSEEQLIEFRNGDSDDPRLREHLATCFECRRALDDRRWELSLRRLRGDAGEHPPRDELLAFWDHALSAERDAEIQRHLRRCNRCLALYGRLRSSNPHRAYASPAPALVSKLKRRLGGPGHVPLLGQLLLEWRPGGGSLRFVPAPEPSVGPQAAALGLLAGDGGTAPSVADQKRERHPASAGARMLRYRRRAARDEAAQAPARSGSENRRVTANLHSNPVSVDVGELILDLQASWHRDRARLTLDAREAATGEPVGRVLLRVEPDEGQPIEETTDPAGRAELTFPPGESALLVLLGEDPVRFTLHGRF